jgi:hypothetical protein
MKSVNVTQNQAAALSGFGAPVDDPKEAELRGMQRMLALVANSDRKDFPTIIGRMRRVIEAASEEVAH